MKQRGDNLIQRGVNLIQRGDNLIQGDDNLKRGDNLNRGDMIFSLSDIVAAATVGEIPTVSQNFRIHEPDFFSKLN